MLRDVIALIHRHPAVLTAILFWSASAILQTVPPLPSNSGFYTTWAHGILQFAAANFNRVKKPLV